MAVHTIPDLLADGSHRFADHPAIVDGPIRVSYRELADGARAVSAGLVGLGVTTGDRVAIWAPNTADYILALLGAERIGAAVVPLNTRYRGLEAHAILARSRAKVLVVADGFLGTDYVEMLHVAGSHDAQSQNSEQQGAAIGGLPHLMSIVDIRSNGSASTVGWNDFLLGSTDLLAQSDEMAAKVAPSTICDILFTSGTTGIPKGVLSTHAQTVGVGDVWARGAGLTADDRYAIVNPFFHGFGYKAGIIAALTRGATVYPVLTFDPVTVMQLIQDEGITVMPGAPTIFMTLIDHPRLADFDLSSLRFATAGATSVPETLFEQMRTVLGFDTVAQAYGLTECMVATQSRPNEDPRHVAQTTGPAVEGIEIRIVDPNGDDVGVGDDGEVWLRGDNVMRGYFEDPVATAEAIDADGWLRTGDVGRFDEHRCLKITDRIKDLFIVGGFNVYPAEVENVLAGHPDVTEAAVIGVPDDRLGHVARAYVIPRSGSAITGDSLGEWCRDRLANFKVPRQFVIVKQFPRNASGKILKRDLRAAP
ncbi:AMP-binding protein [Rhodococcus sp. IEGM1428]|uniref:AMP-binding protein n=1 Tax=Rhodococcus sp. IEGM1428 TaxID=3392191 RepID=UPI003D140158